MDYQLVSVASSGREAKLDTQGRLQSRMTYKLLSGVRFITSSLTAAASLFYLLLVSGEKLQVLALKKKLSVHKKLVGRVRMLVFTYKTAKFDDGMNHHAKE
jgi:hypothetical protein